MLFNMNKHWPAGYDPDLLLVDVDGVLLNWLAGFEKWLMRMDYTINDHVDGVAPDNPKRFQDGMNREISTDTMRAYRRAFKHTAYFEQLPPFGNAIPAIRAIYESGVDIVAITAAGTDHHVQEARLRNIRNHFGHAISKVHFVNPGEPKAKFLDMYADRKAGYRPVWIDDYPRYVREGIDCGLPTIQMVAPPQMSILHNLEHVSPVITDNWMDIVDLYT